MAHKRQQIRDRVVAVLTAAGTAAGANVASGSVWDVAELPAIRVRTPIDKRFADAASMSSDAYSLLLEVALYGAAADSLDDQLDELAVDVETALAGDATLDGLVADLELQETELELVKDHKLPHGRLILRWACLYWTARGNPEA